MLRRGNGPCFGQCLIDRNAQAKHQRGRSRPLERDAFEPVKAVHSIDAGLEKGAFFLCAGHLEDHLRQVGHPGVFFRLGKSG